MTNARPQQADACTKSTNSTTEEERELSQALPGNTSKKNFTMREAGQSGPAVEAKNTADALQQ